MIRVCVDKVGIRRIVEQGLNIDPNVKVQLSPPAERMRKAVLEFTKQFAEKEEVEDTLRELREAGDEDFVELNLSQVRSVLNL